MNTTPLYARITSAVSRPLVLLAALVISVPAEVELARSSGFTNGFEFLMPLTLSAYSAASAIIAANRPRGSKGRISAIVGSGVALGMALSAQVVGHLISSGYMTSGPVLVSLVSSVPALAAAHMLHLAALPRGADKATEEPETDQEDIKDTPSAAPRQKAQRGRMKPSLEVLTGAAKMLREANQPVNAQSLADVFSVSTRTAHRYLSTLKNSALVA
ncbi:helix-turn-helix domain-containing protein [Streptomyces sp. NPDC047860]|uniref:helix-turn-helix domain-containing protein n=1 Tax=Streptomyces sp. NPDC047860 TaxID=3155743 RepID=UPI0033D82B15